MRVPHLVPVVSLMLIAPAALAAPAPSPAPGGPRSPAQPAAPSPRASATPAAQPQPIVALAPIDLTQVPEPCKPLTRQASAADLTVAYATRIALARCMADHAIAPLALCDCAASVVAIDAAVAPAIALLDDVSSSAAPAIQAIAEDTEGQLYIGFVTRMRSTLPAAGSEASPEELALRNMRAQTLDAQLAPWHEAAMASFEHVLDLAKAHPEISRNPATATAIRDAERRVAADVATR
jgi:hypothetical protein